MEKDYSKVSPEILERAIDEVVEEIVDEGKLIHARVGNRWNSQKVKTQIEAFQVESHVSFLDPIDFTEHQSVEILQGKGRTSVSRIAKG